jgi:hypothetical protein
MKTAKPKFHLSEDQKISLLSIKALDTTGKLDTNESLARACRVTISQLTNVLYGGGATKETHNKIVRFLEKQAAK